MEHFNYKYYDEIENIFFPFTKESCQIFHQTNCDNWGNFNCKELVEIKINNKIQNQIHTILANKKFMKKQFELSLKSYRSNEYLSNLKIIAYRSSFEDKIWAKSLIEKVIRQAKIVDNYINIAKIVADSELFDNKAWSEEIFLKALKISDSASDYITIIKSISFIFTKIDAVLLEEIFHDAVNKTEEINHLLELAETIRSLNGVENHRVTCRSSEESKAALCPFSIITDLGFKRAIEKAIEKVELENFYDHSDYSDFHSEHYENLYLNITNTLLTYDKAWMKKVFNMALENIKSVKDIIVIANSILDVEGYNDSVWAKKIYEKTISEVEQKDWSTGENLLYIAKCIADKNCFHDLNWAKEIYKKAMEDTEMTDYYLNIVKSIIGTKSTSLKNWIKEVLKLAIDKNEIVGSSNTNLAKAMFYIFTYKDIALIRGVLESAIDKIKNVDDYKNIVNLLIDNHYYEYFIIEIIEKATKKILEISEEVEEYIKIAVLIIKADDEWATEILKIAIKKATNTKDYLNLLEVYFYDFNLDNKSWIKDSVKTATVITEKEFYFPYDDEKGFTSCPRFLRKMLFYKAISVAVEVQDYQDLVGINQSYVPTESLTKLALKKIGKFNDCINLLSSFDFHFAGNGKFQEELVEIMIKKATEINDYLSFAEMFFSKGYLDSNNGDKILEIALKKAKQDNNDEDLNKIRKFIKEVDRSDDDSASTQFLAYLFS